MRYWIYQGLAAATEVIRDLDRGLPSAALHLFRERAMTEKGVLCRVVEQPRRNRTAPPYSQKSAMARLTSAAASICTMWPLPEMIWALTFAGSSSAWEAGRIRSSEPQMT